MSGNSMLRLMQDIARQLTPSTGIDVTTAQIPGRQLQDGGGGITADEDNPTMLGEADRNPAAIQLVPTNISVRMKVLLSFAAIVLLKILVDNFLHGLAAVVAAAVFCNIKKYFDAQIALKDRSNMVTMTMQLITCASFMSSLIRFISILVPDPYSLKDRLSLIYPNKDESLHFFTVLWYCIVTDTVVQYMQLTMKLLICCVLGWSNSLDFSLCKKWLCCAAAATAGTHSSALSCDHSATVGGYHAMEGGEVTGGAAGLSIAALSSSLDFSSFSSSLTGLVRRQVSSNLPVSATTTGTTTGTTTITTTPSVGNSSSNGNAGVLSSSVGTIGSRGSFGVNSGRTSGASSSSSHPPPPMNDNRDHNLPVADSSSNSTTASTDNARASQDYLCRLRLCSLIDILSLLYRTLLPIPLWSFYFDHGKWFGPVFGILYLCMKGLDMSWKTKGAVQALHLFFTNGMEYGHYSTQEELQGSEEGAVDCPVCFDNPHKPVTLDCKHVFCEVCISEWLDKERTCPVCRQEVKYCSASLGAVKIDAADFSPMYW